MPQMAPISWLTLFMIFLVIYFFTTMKVYFTNSKTIDKINENNFIKKLNLNWKW